MGSLFIDTSNNLSIGLLDPSFSWLSFDVIKEAKSSGVIHYKIDELCRLHSLGIDELKNIFIVNGPGSYTGVRVSEGIGQIFNWQGVNTYSFHHHLIPELSGVNKGSFLCSAFKGEYFIYEWDSGKKVKSLISESELNCKIRILNKCYTNQMAEISFDCIKIIDTMEVIKSRPGDIFPVVIKKSLRLEPFYFRKLKEEFKKKEEAK